MKPASLFRHSLCSLCEGKKEAEWCDYCAPQPGERVCEFLGLFALFLVLTLPWFCADKPASQEWGRATATHATPEAQDK